MRYDAIVIGVGGMGSARLFHLARTCWARKAISGPFVSSVPRTATVGMRALVYGLKRL